MFCAFEGPPKIVRLHGRGCAILEGEPGFADLLAPFDLCDQHKPLVRSIVTIAVDRVSDSCGFGVPRMNLVAERVQMPRWADQK